MFIAYATFYQLIKLNTEYQFVNSYPLANESKLFFTAPLGTKSSGKINLSTGNITNMRIMFCFQPN
jgi:hypothetical protein